MSNLPDDFNAKEYDRRFGARAIAYENAIEREYDDLLFELTYEEKAPASGLTGGQKLIAELVSEDDLDGTLFAGFLAAAKHLKDKSVTPEAVGQAFIDALRKDLYDVAERRAGDSE